MTNFSWSKGLGFGVLIWAAMAVVLWILGAIDSLGPLWAHGIVAGVGGITAFLFARNASPANGTQAAGYGVVWAAVVLLLDFAVAQWFDAHIFAAWQYWLGAALVFLAPWLEAETTATLSHPV